jgi:hypothetical protein
MMEVLVMVLNTLLVVVVVQVLLVAMQLQIMQELVVVLV